MDYGYLCFFYARIKNSINQIFIHSITNRYSDSNLYWIHWNDLLHPLEWDGEAGGQKVNGWTLCQLQSGRSIVVIDVRWGRGGCWWQAGRDVIFCSVSRWSDPSDPLTSAKESHDVRREKPSAPLSLPHEASAAATSWSSPSQSPVVHLHHLLLWICCISCISDFVTHRGKLIGHGKR